MNRRRFLSWLGVAPVAAATVPVSSIGGRRTAATILDEPPFATTPSEARYFFGDPNVAQRGGFLAASDLQAEFARLWRGGPSAMGDIPVFPPGAPSEPE